MLVLKYAAMSTQILQDSQVDVITAPASVRTVPPWYQVVLLNDDYTPMAFVVQVLRRFFGKSAEEATRIMLQVHHEGRGVAGVYTRDIAASRVAQVIRCAQMCEHPLQCLMEPVRT